MSERQRDGNIVTMKRLRSLVEAPPSILGNTLYSKWSSVRERIPYDARWSRLRDGRRSGTAQTENTVRHTKYGRIRGMVVGEGGRSTGVLLYSLLVRSKHFKKIQQMIYKQFTKAVYK